MNDLSVLDTLKPQGVVIKSITDFKDYIVNELMAITRSQVNTSNELYLKKCANINKLRPPSARVKLNNKSKLKFYLYKWHYGSITRI